MNRKILFLLPLLVLFFGKTFAQLGIEKRFDRFDSVSTLLGVKGLNEDANSFILYNDYSVLKVDKVNGNIDTLYLSAEIIVDAFVDSTGKYGILLSKKILLDQSGSWLTVNIPTAANALNVMVDSSGAIFVASAVDSIFKYQNGNWVNSKLYFPNSLEYFKSFVGSNHHRCLIYSTNRKVYEFDGNNLILKYNLINNYGITNMDVDQNENLWFLSYGVLKKMSLNGFENNVSMPNPGNISSFKLTGANGAFWYCKNGDSLFYFDGTIKYFVFSEKDYLTLFKVHNNRLVVLNKTTYNNYENNNTMSFLAHIQDSLLINRFNFSKPLIGQNVNAILVCNAYSPVYRNQFLIATDNSLYLRRTDFNYNIVYKRWDTLNCSLPTNKIFDMASYLNYNYGYNDTFYLATNKGIIKAGIESDSLIIYEVFNQQNANLPSDTIIKLGVKHSSNTTEIWAGTLDKGVARINENGTTLLLDTTNSLLPSNSIRHIALIDEVVCITTNHGFLVVVDTMQQSFTTANANLLTEDINSVNVYRNNYIWNNPYKYELIVNTNGAGFALIDTSNIWHYYNTQNQNFNCDTVYFFDRWEMYGYSLFVGTSNGVKEIAGFSNNINYMEWEISNQENNLRSVDFHAVETNCAEVSYRGGLLCKNGIIGFEACFGGYSEMNKSKPIFEASFNDSQLMVNFKLSGAFKLDLLDINGRLVFTFNSIKTGSYNFPIPPLDQGIYLVRLYNAKEAFSNKVMYSK
jgi:hypothetical protein